MKAQGEHILIRKPNQKKVTEAGLFMPDAYDQIYSYGRVVSVGSEVLKLGVDVAEGAIVVYDTAGTRPLELDSMKDSDLVVAHASQIYCTMVDKELESRKLPAPA